MIFASRWPRGRRAAAATCLSVLLLSPGAGAEDEAADPLAALPADVRVTGLRFVASRDGAPEFTLEADHGLLVPHTRIAHLTQMRVVGAEGIAADDFAVRCDQGEFDVETNDFYAKGNVEGTAADGREYTAPWVRYDYDKALLYTDAPVVMQDDTGTFRGDGFRYYVREQRFRLLGNVSLVQP